MAAGPLPQPRARVFGAAMDRGQSVTDLIELERLDPGHDDFRGFNPAQAGPAGGRFKRSPLSFAERRPVLESRSK